jgi:glycosyltransferase involved in cell wall biosynthesis
MRSPEPERPDRTDPLPFVSVIVPVFNDADHLRRCLERLQAQTYPGDRYEILVIDNGSVEPVDALVSAFDRARLVLEPKPGQFRARNTGVAASKGSVLAFTDSDCLPMRDWLERGVRRLLARPNCGQIGGRVQVFLRHPERPTAVEVYEALRAFPQKRYVEQEHYAVTANMFTFRSVYDAVGPFDERMISGGDNEWGQRVHRHGLDQAYCDTAIVLHPARRSFDTLGAKVRRTSTGHQHIESLRGGKPYSLRRFLYDLRPPVTELLGTLTDPRLKGIRPRLQCMGVTVYVRVVRAWARLRLALGQRISTGYERKPR